MLWESWPKVSLGFFPKMLRKNPNELFGQPSIRYGLLFFSSCKGEKYMCLLYD